MGAPATIASVIPFTADAPGSIGRRGFTSETKGVDHRPPQEAEQGELADPVAVGRGKPRGLHVRRDVRDPGDAVAVGRIPQCPPDVEYGHHHPTGAYR